MFGTAEAPTQITRHRIAAADNRGGMRPPGRSGRRVAQAARQAPLQARRLPEDSQAEIAPLLEAYTHMLGPSRLLRGARHRITEGLRSAEQATSDEANAIAAALLEINTDDAPAGKRRADEVLEIARRLIRI